ncbi:hypothetical protein TRAPUB_5006 [Trametes pubescens]|uniref:F-box domain-containing protein n=1 Tax=Trametes pubescens TaxID=154538 RepID=A0A1M2V9Q7_TRAPU|nr:hypothetical protein TRAPUB_5006 [Trametes pubescens]
MSPTLTLPVETIEHAISLLRGDIPSLAACSLTCHALLPISRVHLWHEVVLPIELDAYGSHSARVEAFIRIMNRNRNIAAYIRSVVVCPSPGYSYMDGIEFDGVTWATLGAQLPAIRSLRLRDILLLDLAELVPIIRDRPTLEALILDNVGMMSDDNYSFWPPSLAQPATGAAAVGGQPSRWALRTLSVFGNAIPMKELSRLVLFLEQSTEVMSLEALDICCAMAPPEESPRRPVVWPGIPSFGASLRHFGITFRDTKPQARIAVDPVGREHVQRVISDLPRCISLRSLRLGYERTGAFMLGALLPSEAGTSSGYTPTPFFLELLVDVLSASGPAPLPLLEELTLVFGGPPTWLAGFEAAFTRLADVLVGDHGGAEGAPGSTTARRYPRFSRLDVRTISLSTLTPFFEDGDVEQHRGRLEMERLYMILPMLAGFVEAGVHVEVTCE